MDLSEEVIFEDYLYKLSEPRAGKLSFGKAKWKQKFFQLKRIGDKPALDYFNKKPKTSNSSPKGRIWLHLSFRIEKIPNTKNRAFVFELTTSESQVCLSADEQKTIDMFVFLLQVQVRLQDNIKDDLIYVVPESSEAMHRIGAVGTRCILHASPWGMTLALQQSRCILSQWPIKSIRCYESSGRGLLTLEAGRIAPMGEGIYLFQTQPEEDSSMYDLLDRYIMETLDRAKITRRGTDQEIEDYLQEIDRMHTLTTIKPCPLTSPGLPQILRNNWNYIVPGTQVETNNNPLMNGRIGHAKQNSDVSITSQSSRSSSDSTSKPIPIVPSGRHAPHVSHSSSANQIAGETRLTGRPPAPPPRSVKIPQGNSILNQRVPKPRMANSNGSMEGYLGMSSPSPSKSFGSPLSPKSPGAQDWEPPPSFNDVMNIAGSRLTSSGYLTPVLDDNMDVSRRSRADGRVNRTSSGSESSHQNSDSSLRRVDSSEQYLSPVPSDGGSYLQGQYLRGYNPPSHVPSYENATAADEQAAFDMKQASASCEDLSDHMKSQLYYNDGSDNDDNRNPQNVDENMNSDKPPMPFTRLQAFRNSADWDVRDRSKSVDYYNVMRPGVLIDRSPSPSVRRIRKLMGKNNQALRKSVSNPNFLNVGSKEVYNYMKSNNYRPSSCHGSPKIERQSRSKSKSLVDLLPEAIRRHLSHENLHRSRNGTPSHSRSATPERNEARHVKENGKPPLNRQLSAKSFEASVKNIKVGERTRSFRKMKSLDNDLATKASDQRRLEVMQRQEKDSTNLMASSQGHHHGNGQYKHVYQQNNAQYNHPRNPNSNAHFHNNGGQSNTEYVSSDRHSNSGYPNGSVSQIQFYHRRRNVASAPAQHMNPVFISSSHSNV